MTEVTADGYLSLCQHAAVIVGNSSSGIIEMPSMAVPSVDVGIRQKGRLRGPSVFGVSGDADSIASVIGEALIYDGPWHNPYEGENASAEIAEIVATYDLEGIMVKG